MKETEAMKSQSRRLVRISIEATIMVEDKEQLIAAALNADPGTLEMYDITPEAIRNDIVEACRALLPDWADAVLPGVMFLTQSVNATGTWATSDNFSQLGFSSETPPFAKLFKSGLITPRTAFALWGASLRVEDLADGYLTSVERDPQSPDTSFFDLYPRIVHGQDQEWWERAIQCIRDLGDDLRAGRTPEPRCIGEEVALWLILRFAEDALKDEGESTEAGELPKKKKDYDFDLLASDLYQDHDFRMLYDASLDGIEDPENEINANLRMGDMRGGNWFTWFLNVEPRKWA